MTETIQTQLDDLRALRLPDLQARFAELVGEETRCPNKAFLLRRIGEALEAQVAAEDDSGSPTPEERAPEAEPIANEDHAESSDALPEEAESDAPDDDDPSEGGVRLRDLDVEALRARYVEVVGRGTGSHDRRYVELTDMGSCCLPAACSPEESSKLVPHIHEPADGRMTLSSPRSDACMATSAGSWRSEGERA